MTADGLGSCLVMEGAAATAVFEAYVKRVLAPSLTQTGGLNNLGMHKGEREVEGWCSEFLFLPTSSLDFSAIEETFSKVKTLMRKTPPHAPAGHLWSHRSSALGRSHPKTR